MSERADAAAPRGDEQLLTAFLGGSEIAFAALVERYGGELFQFVFRFVRSAAAAEDVVQETFVQVYQSAAGFNPERRFRPWLFTIAANKARDYLRSRSRKREVPLTTGSSSDSEEISYLDFLADESPAPGVRLEADEQRAIVRRIIEQMPDNLREMLILGYFQRFSYKEMAEILSIPLGTVKSRLHTAVSYFADLYQQEEQKRTGVRTEQ